jgi:hypothetical protein
MKTLQIKWQRLVDEQGETCVRCGITEGSVEEAAERLRKTVKSLDIDVALEKVVIDPSDFEEAPLESNRIWIAGKPLEDWLSATISQSQCGTACGDSECRTMVIDGKAYESISADLIVKAGLRASSDLMLASPSQPSNGCGCSCSAN